jgi:hypothetical protein
MKHAQSQITMLSAQAANGASSAYQAMNFDDTTFQLHMSAFTGTVKFVGSDADTAPDFSSAVSGTNPYEYIQVQDEQNNTGITGDTGVAGTATTDVRYFSLNSPGKKWIGAIVSGYSAGNCTLKMTGWTTT